MDPASPTTPYTLVLLMARAACAFRDAGREPRWTLPVAGRPLLTAALDGLTGRAPPVRTVLVACREDLQTNASLLHAATLPDRPAPRLLVVNPEEGDAAALGQVLERLSPEAMRHRLFVAGLDYLLANRDLQWACSRMLTLRDPPDCWLDLDPEPAEDWDVSVEAGERGRVLDLARGLILSAHRWTGLVGFRSARRMGAWLGRVAEPGPLLLPDFLGAMNEHEAHLRAEITPRRFQPGTTPIRFPQDYRRFLPPEPEVVFDPTVHLPQSPALA